MALTVGLQGLRDPSLSVRIWVMALITVLQRLRDPSFHCVPLRMTWCLMENRGKKKKGSGAAAPFFPPPHPRRALSSWKDPVAILLQKKSMVNEATNRSKAELAEVNARIKKRNTTISSP